MFTGIIEATGRVEAFQRQVQGARLVVRPDAPLPCNLGESLSVNGACLTVAELGVGGETYAFDLSPETLKLTTLGFLAPGDALNLERALKIGDRLGGHFVSGHVDGIAKVKAVRKTGVGAEMDFSVPPDLTPYIAQKGSVSVEGVSLTPFTPTSEGFSVALVAHTLLHTTLDLKKPGDVVNLEVDLLARYVKRLMDTK
jgi:riboflavin synthase